MSQTVITAERLSDLIALIYDCAVDPTGWPIALEAIRLELRCHNATLDLLELPSGASLTSATSNIPPAYLPLLAGAGPDVAEQWGGEERLRTVPLDRPAVMSWTTPDLEARMATNGYYQAFAKPQGIIDVIAIPLARDARGFGGIGFGRHASAGPITDREVAVAQLLLPHLQRAATINRLLERSMGAQATLSATLDALAVPVALLDAERQLKFANNAAHELLAEGALVRLVNGRVEPGSASAAKAFAAAISDMTRGISTTTSRGIGLPIQLDDGRVGALHILPLVGKARGGPADNEAVATVFFNPLAKSDEGVMSLATELFGLTPRETTVFRLLATGRSQTEAAEKLTLGLATVKTHLKNIYAKIGVNSQVELMATAAALIIPLV